MATSKLIKEMVGGVIGLAALATMPVPASECAHFTSTDARAEGELRLCEHAIDDAPTTFACREYRDAHTRFLLLFKGGPLPKAIYHDDVGASAPTLRLVHRSEVANRSCRQPPPAGIPAAAVYRGTGVCQDAHDRVVPCSMYEHAAARNALATRYLVLYDPHGAGPNDIDAQVAGNNEDALVAELAFLMGVQLLNSECCRERAQEYLAYAHGLFPDEPVYRAAYEQTLASAQARGGSRDHPSAATVIEWDARAPADTDCTADTK